MEFSYMLDGKKENGVPSLPCLNGETRGTHRSRLIEIGTMRFVVSHPLARKKRMDGAPSAYVDLEFNRES